jgi:predicted transposase YdaD
VETILVYKLPRLSREEIQKMLGYNDIELKQTRFYQDVFTEGRQEGLHEGLHEGEAKIILRQLNHQLGNLTPKTITNIQKLNSDQLETLADKVFDFTTQNDLDAWLEQTQ